MGPTLPALSVDRSNLPASPRDLLRLSGSARPMVRPWGSDPASKTGFAERTRPAVMVRPQAPPMV